MAITYVKEVGFVVNNSAGISSAMTVAAGGVPLGDSVVIIGACDNTGASGAATTITVTDTRSNTWTLETPQALQDTSSASSGIQAFLVTSIISTALQAGDTITVTYGNSTTAKSINAQQFTGTNKSTVVLSGSYLNNNVNSDVEMDLGPLTTTAISQVVVVGIGCETPTTDTFNGDTDTTNGSWVPLTRRGAGSGTAAITLNSAYKITTATGAQNYHGDFHVADAAGVAAILDVDVSTPTPATVTSPAVINVPQIYPVHVPVVTGAAVVNAPTIKWGDTVTPSTVTSSAVVNTPADLLFDKIIFPETVDAG